MSCSARLSTASGIRKRLKPTLLLLMAVMCSFLGKTFAGEEATVDINRLTSLQSNSPYAPSTSSARLVTPQWIGEPGVDAVVVLAIDDMRDEPKYENYLRPILQRLKQIDGRAPVSIMTCRINAGSSLHQQWLEEGLSLDIHTYDHPCPILKDGDFQKARQTYERCVDLLHEIPGNQPVAFRTPCCDSLNTVSPRFFSGIFNQVTPGGHFLTLDSSVFVVLNDHDPQLPERLVRHSDGRPRFERYVPQDRAFGNTIDNYPYPYVIQRLCWELPCMAPSDWSAQHLQQPFNPQTVEDWQRALDATVLKQGVMTMVFHPHGWIRSDQMVELIDYAQSTYGKRVKFLTFREVEKRLNTHLLGGHPLRAENGQDNAVRVLDINRDGLQDVLIDNGERLIVRLWNAEESRWQVVEQPRLFDVRRSVFGEVGTDSHATLVAQIVESQVQLAAWSLESQRFVAVPSAGLPNAVASEFVVLRDVDGNGRTELLAESAGGKVTVAELVPEDMSWKPVAGSFPSEVRLGLPDRHDTGLRFVDLDDDGDSDLLYSTPETSVACLYESPEVGWSRRIESKQGRLLPSFLKEGFEAGVWFHSEHVWIQNESTAGKPDLVERVAFADIVAQAEPVPLEPASSRASIQVPEGFVVELVAAEPLIQDPVAFDWDHVGRLWVVEMADYPDSPDPHRPAGRIKILTDDDGDGTYDRAEVFLENVNSPNGVMPYRDGVLISAAPDILFARDESGDGRADHVEKLYSGFVEGNQQHRVNGFVWGLDNWLHVANGDSGGVIRSHQTGEELNLSGRDFRIRPETGQIELVTGRTQFGRRRDDWGNWFGCNNSHPMYHFVLDEHYLRRNPHLRVSSAQIEVPDTPGAAPCFPISRPLPRFNDFDRLNRFTSACSAMVYRDELLGPGFESTMLVSEPVHNLVHREQLHTTGVEVRSRRLPEEADREFLASADNWFRPTMLRTGPDGALWVADMYRLVIEHPQYIPQELQQQWDLHAGKDRGRIYRVFRKSQPPRAIPRLGPMTSEQLVLQLESPNGWVRDRTQQLLRERHGGSAVDAASIAELVRERFQSSQRAATRLQALSTLDGLQQLQVNDVLRALRDAHPTVVRHAIRMSEGFLDSSEVVNEVIGLTAHEDPFVTLQLAYTLGELPSDQAAGPLASVARRAAGDRWLSLATQSSINAQNVISVLEHLQRQEPDAALRPLLGQLLELAIRFGQHEAAFELLAAWLTNKPAATVENYGLVSDLLPVLNPVMPRLRQHEAGQQLLTGMTALHTSALAHLTEPEPAARWQAAVRFLGRTSIEREATQQALLRQLQPRLSIELQQQVLDALAGHLDAHVMDGLVQRWQSLTPALRTRMIDHLLSRESTIGLLLDAVATGEITTGDLTPLQRQSLLAHRSPAIRDRSREVLQATTETNRSRVVDAYRSALRMDGDVAEGRKVFEKRCATCHRLGDVGKVVGPDLAALSDPSPESLLVAILDPSRNVESRYQAYIAVTEAGLTLNGLLTAESGSSLTLTSADGKQQTLVRSELEELANTGKSFMPEGLEQDVSPQQLAHLLSFVRSAGPSPKSFPGNSPQTIQRNDAGSYLLTADRAQIFGKTLVFEPKLANLGYWGSIDDRALWELEVAEDGKFDVVLEYACPPDTAGNRVRVSLGGGQWTAEVQATGSWEQYREFTVGQVQLNQGRHTLTVRSDGAVRNYLFDLRRVRLSRSKR